MRQAIKAASEETFQIALNNHKQFSEGMQCNLNRFTLYLSSSLKTKLEQQIQGCESASRNVNIRPVQILFEKYEKFSVANKSEKTGAKLVFPLLLQV